MILSRRRQPRSQIRLIAILCDRQAINRANVDAGIALDAELCRKHRLDVAVETAFDLLDRLLGCETEFDLDVELS